MKHTKFILVVLFSLFLIPSFTSCDKEDDSGSLKGLWLPMDEFYDWVAEYPIVGHSDGNRGALLFFNFINSNTVEYGTVDVYEKYRSNALYSKTVGGITYYFTDKLARTYTYVFEGNKLIITNGEICTLINGKLWEDGGEIYTKVK